MAQAPLGLERTLSVIADVGAGLDALHRGRIVPQDVKPSNVMLREDSSAALTDFGLAKGAAYTVLTARPGAGNAGLPRARARPRWGGNACERHLRARLRRVRVPGRAAAVRRPEPVRRGDGAPRRQATRSADVTGRRLGVLRALEKDPAARPATATMCANLLRVASRP